MKLQLAKGTRDFSPEEKIARDQLTATLTALFERYGFSPLETPIIERMDILSAKYAAGEDSDALKEIFQLQDQGGRSLGLRFDLTVPLARYVGMNPTLKMPFKRYQIGKVYRDGPIKTGRYREFWQYDIDIVGSAKMRADAEIINIIRAVFTALELDVIIKVNNRKLLTSIITQAGISEDLTETVITSVDKYDKTGRKGVIAELLDKGFDKEEASRILDGLDQDLNGYEQLLPENEGIKELKELFSLFPEDDRVRFTPNLARGLAYYTGTVIEVFSANEEINFSLAGGGRYDRMIGQYLGSKENIPAVGLAFGFEPILEVLKKQNKLRTQKSVTNLYVIPIGNVEVRDVVQELRDAQINTDVDLNGRGISKNIRYAASYDIPYALFIGEDELKAGKYKLKDLNEGTEETLTLKEIIQRLKR